MTIPPRKRVTPGVAHNTDQAMPSILFPPLLSLETSGSSKGGGTSCMQGAQDVPCQDRGQQQVHDCYPRRPSSEGRRRIRRSMKEPVSCLHHSQSMPSFERMIKMADQNSMDDFFVGAAPERSAANIGAAVPSEAEGGLDQDIPFPTCIPKLRIRRVSSEKDLKIMPSPLARRGGKEMEYLQKQLKAEAFIRRKQQLHNEERNRRRESKNDDADPSEDEDTFAYAPKNFRRGRLNNTIMDLAGSPPAILKKYSFKRTVSETLKDSGIPEDANLLFTPMGKPLIDDEHVGTHTNQEDHEHTSLETEGETSSETEEVFVMDEDASLCSSNRTGSRRNSIKDDHILDEELGVGGSTLNDDEDQKDDVELSSSLLSAGSLGDSFRNGTKSDSPPNAYKKITLRPKMKVRTDSSDFTPPLGTHTHKPSDLEILTNGPILKDDEAVTVDPLPVGKGKYASPQKSRFSRTSAQRFMLAGSESFDALTFEDRVSINNDAMYSRARLNTADSDYSDRLGASPSFSESNYATPDNSFSNRQSVRSSKQKSRYAARRFMMAGSESFDALSLEDREAINNDAISNRTGVNTADSGSFDRLGVSPSFSESNYATPDNSFSNRQSVRASKLFSKNQYQGPELPLTTSPFSEQNYHTPSSSQSRRFSERMGVPNQLPLAPIFGATIEEENTAFLHVEATPEPNFTTPQNILERRVDRRDNLLSVPQFAELIVPQLGSATKLGSPTKPQEVGAAPSTEEEKKEFDSEEESYSEELRCHSTKSPQ